MADRQAGRVRSAAPGGAQVQAQFGRGREAVGVIAVAELVGETRARGAHVETRQQRGVGADADVPGSRSQIVVGVDVQALAPDRPDVLVVGRHDAELPGGIPLHPPVVRLPVVTAVIVHDGLKAASLGDDAAVVEHPVVQADRRVVERLHQYAEIGQARGLGRQPPAAKHGGHGEVVAAVHDPARGIHRALPDALSVEPERVGQRARAGIAGGLKHAGRLEGRAPGRAQREPVVGAELRGDLRVRGASGPVVALVARGKLQLRAVAQIRQALGEHRPHVLIRLPGKLANLPRPFAGDVQRVRLVGVMQLAVLRARGQRHRPAAPLEQVPGGHELHHVLNAGGAFRP